MARIRTYTQEFRDSAVQMMKAEGMSIPNTLQGWAETASGGPPPASTRAAHRGTAGSDAALQQRVRELEAENRQLRIDREILKKATAGSTGQRNACVHPIRRRLVAQSLARPLVELERHSVELGLRQP
jgi:transposase